MACAPARAAFAGRRIRNARIGAIVSLVTSPAQTRSHSAESTMRSSGTPAAASSSGQNDAPRSRRCSRSASWTGPSGGVSGSGGATSRSVSRNPSAIRPSSAPIPPAPIHTTSPLAQSASRSAGRYPRTRERRTSDSTIEAGIEAPCSCAIASTSAVGPCRGTVAACHSGANRPSAGASTGSTSLRSAASERRRIERSTSASHHSRSSPPGRNSPRTTRPCDSSEATAPATRSSPTPNRAATSAVPNGPWVRANRATRPSSGAGVGSVNTVGTPSGSDAPSASRYRPASSTATNRSCPATRRRIARPSRSRSPSQPVGSAFERAETSSAVRSPSRRSRSWTSSALRARRPSARCCSSSSSSASATGSISSRRSSAPSSSRRSSRSSESAAARRSAIGASASYM